MSQTRTESFVEAWVNVVIGFNINYFANLLLFPLFDMHISPGANFVLGCIYTVISVCRSYAIRRWFNSYLHSFSLRVAGWISKSHTGLKILNNWFLDKVIYRL